jgi:predicted AlkP superfamily pyrophosphatase or phosphodiesterase
MLRTARFLCLTSTLLFAATLHAATKKVIVISIDGLRGTTLASLATRNLQTPNLNEFANGGALSDGLFGVYPTVTYPSHTTLVTGVTPNQHGILGNLMFDPEHELDAAWYWYAQQIQRPTLYTIAKDKGLTTASVFWPVTVGARIDYNFPEYREPDTAESLLLYGGICTQGLLAAFEKSTHPLKAEHIDDDTRASMANFLIATYKPDLLLIHFADVDHQEHLHGPDSTESLKSVENVDRLIGLLRQQVKTSEPSDQVDFIIVSDHGFRPVEKQFSPSAVLTSLGLEGTKENPEKWRVSAFDNGASFGLVAHDPNDTDAIALATKTFKQLTADGSWGIDKFYDASETRALQGYSNSFASISMKSGFTLSGTAVGPWLSNTQTRGMHGYAPGPTELDASFLAFGPDIPHRHLPRAKLVDVAPTVAHILDLQMSNIEGHDLLKQ